MVSQYLAQTELWFISTLYRINNPKSRNCVCVGRKCTDFPHTWYTIYGERRSSREVCEEVNTQKPPTVRILAGAKSDSIVTPSRCSERNVGISRFSAETFDSLVYVGIWYRIADSRPVDKVLAAGPPTKDTDLQPPSRGEDSGVWNIHYAWLHRPRCPRCGPVDSFQPTNSPLLYFPMNVLFFIVFQKLLLLSSFRETESTIDKTTFICIYHLGSFIYYVTHIWTIFGPTFVS